MWCLIINKRQLWPSYKWHWKIRRICWKTKIYCFLYPFRVFWCFWGSRWFKLQLGLFTALSSQTSSAAFPRRLVKVIRMLLQDVLLPWWQPVSISVKLRGSFVLISMSSLWGLNQYHWGGCEMEVAYLLLPNIFGTYLLEKS